MLSEDEEIKFYALIDSLDSGEPFRKTRRPKRGLHRKLQGLVTASQIQKIFGGDSREAAASIRQRGVSLSWRQMAAYFAGQFTPPREKVVAIANVMRQTDLAARYDWPWELLSFCPLSLAQIENICTPTHSSTFELKRQHRTGKILRGQSRWHDARSFLHVDNWLEHPQSAQDFWQSVASFRAAEALKDFHSMNYHRWSTVALLPSLLQDEHVSRHSETLYACVASLTRRTREHFVWFSIDWAIVRQAVALQDFGRDSSFNPFRDVFFGRRPNIG